MALMDWSRDCAAVIPCFDEAADILRVVTEVEKHLSMVIVVDDGSTDATAKNAVAGGAEILRLPQNLGKGAALRRGWQHAQRLGFKWVLMLDGDGQHAAEDVPRFFDAVEKTGATLVVGNRMKNCEAMPFVRRWVNRWMSRRISRMTGAQMPDSQCGFRLAHLQTLLGLPLRANRFEIESAMLVAFLAAGRRVAFVPVQTIYGSRASKIQPLADSWRWLKWRLAQHTPLRACNTIRVP
jgi:glycosyltransferase involved in cell wall biosynthesis